METDSQLPVSASVWKDVLVPLFFFGLICYIANFLLAPFFGIYEDDYTLFLPMQAWHWKDFVGYLSWCVTTAPQARPLGWVLNGTLAYVTHGHSLFAGYLIGWAILTINSVLLYSLLRKVAGPLPAIAGTLTYILLPMDLSKVILMLRAYVHLSMTCLLLGLHLYRNGTWKWRVASYFVAPLSLIIWEGFYLPFIVAPLLVPGSLRSKIKELSIHAVLCLTTIGVALGLRFLAGEDRVVTMANSDVSMLGKMLLAMAVGPTTGLSTFLIRPVDTWVSADTFLWVCGIVIGVLIWYAARQLTETERTAPDNADEKSTNVSLWYLGAASIIAMVFPYVLMYRVEYFPPNITMGRSSCCHAPAAIGYCLFVTFLVGCAAKVMKQRKVIWTAALAAYFGLLGAFAVFVQRNEYAGDWEIQKYIWRRVISLCADAQEGTPVVLDIDGMPRSIMFSALWIEDASAGLTLSKFVKWPAGCKKRPNIYVLCSWRRYSIGEKYEPGEHGRLIEEDWRLTGSGTDMSSKGLLRGENQTLGRVVIQ